jgi:hypothetical protein
LKFCKFEIGTMATKTNFFTNISRMTDCWEANLKM